MSVTSLSVARVKRSNDPCDWTLADMLQELSRRITAGEIPGDAKAVLLLETDSKLHALVAGITTIDEAASLVARGIRVL